MRATRKANSLSQWDDNMPYPQGSMPNRALQRLEERARSGAGQPRWERSDSNYDDSYDYNSMERMQGGGMSGGMQGGMQRVMQRAMQQQPGMQPGMAEMQPGMPEMTVIVPPGLVGGMPMQVDAPTGPLQVVIPDGLQPGQAFQVAIPTDEPAGIFPPYTQPSPQYMQQSEMLGPPSMDGMGF